MLALPPVTWKDRVANGSVIAGSPETVTERLRESCKDLGVGHLMLLLQLGNLSHERTMRNVEVVATKVLPHLQDLWSEWEDHWWIRPLARPVLPRVVTDGDDRRSTIRSSEALEGRGAMEHIRP